MLEICVVGIVLEFRIFLLNIFSFFYFFFIQLKIIGEMIILTKMNMIQVNKKKVNIFHIKVERIIGAKY